MKTLKENKFYLDFIKVMAILLLILFHFISEVEVHALLENPDAFKIGGISLLNLGGVNLTLGNYAYSMLFVLMGAGLMHTYQNQLEIKDFYKKQAISIYPIYYVTFIAAFLVQIILDKRLEHGTPVWSFILTVLGIDGWAGEIIPTYALVGEWFVGCILGSFLIFPLLRKFMNKNANATVVVYGILFLMWEHFYPFDIPKRMDLFLRTFEVLLGMYFVKMNRRVTWRSFGISASLLGIIFAVRIPWLSAYILSPVAGISLFLALNYISQWFSGKKIEKTIVFMSHCSFPVYLIHHFLLVAILERVPEHSLGIAGMLMLFIICMTGIWAVGIGLKKLELKLAGTTKYEAIYLAYISKIFLAISAVIYLGHFVYLAGTQAPSFDGSMNLQVPVSLIKYGTYATTYNGIELFSGRIQTGIPVLLPIAVLFKVLGTGSLQALMVNVLYIALFIFFVYAISKELSANRTVILLVMGATTLLWSFSELAMGIFGEIPTLALFLGMVYFLILAEKGNKKGGYALSGLFFGFAYLTKTVILIAVPALILVFASKWLLEKKMHLKDLLMWIGGTIFPVGIFEIYKIFQLGLNKYIAYWSNQSDNVMRQAGVKAGYEDTANLFEKLGIHLNIYAETFNIQIAALLAILVLNFIWFVCKMVKRRKFDYIDIIELIVYSYFGWWLLITPTEKAWGRRIIIGVVLLEWLSSMKLLYIFEWIIEKIKLANSNNRRAIAETVISIFALIFISLGATNYTRDNKAGDLELAEVVRQKVEDEGAVICGNGWWQAPTISFYSGVEFKDLAQLDLTSLEVPAYFVADTAWIIDSEETEADLPYPVELVYEEAYTGQRLYRLKLRKE